MTTSLAEGQVYRVYGPVITRGYKESSARFSNRIERPEARLILFNHGKERGVRQGELFDNIVGFRRLGRDDLPLETHFYESVSQLRRELIAPIGSLEGFTVHPLDYDSFVRSVDIYDDQRNKIETRQFPPTFYPQGALLFRLREGRVLDFHMTLPVPLPGVKPDPLQVEVVEILSNMIAMDLFSADETGRGALTRYREDPQLRAEVNQYFRDHPPATLKPNMRIDQAAIRLLVLQ